MKNELTDEQIDIVLDASSLTLIVESGTHCIWAVEFARAAIAAHEAIQPTNGNAVTVPCAALKAMQDEIAALRKIISDTVAALGSGASAGEKCSLGFLQQIPDEVRETVRALRSAIGTVCEGWTLPHDARKILESALWPVIAQSVQPGPHGRQCKIGGPCVPLGAAPCACRALLDPEQVKTGTV